VDPDLVATLTDFGALGLSAGFIAWLYVKMQHRLDQMVEKFQGQIEAMQDRCDTRESELRSRYDAVIENYNTERDLLLQGVTSQMKETAVILRELKEGIETVGDHVNTGLAEMRQHYAVLDAQRRGKDKQ
jgi:cytidylate kinase